VWKGSGMFFDNNGIKIEINNISGKPLRDWKLKKIVLNNLWAKEEIKREIRKYFELNEYKNYVKICGKLLK
jgi:hypothetical protein